MNKYFAYIRVSSKDQCTDRQMQAINDYCSSNNIQIDDDDIVIDKESGKDFNRKGYQLLKNKLLREGDTVIIKELDRLGRNMQQIKIEWQDLINNGINIIVIDTPILNTTNKTDLEKSLISNIVFELLSYMAEKERIKIKQRQAEGIAQAKAQGKHLGRPKVDYKALSKHQKALIKEYYQSWKDGNITALKFMEILELKKNTFYKIMKEYEQNIVL